MTYPYRRRRPNSKPKQPSNKKAVENGVFQFIDSSPPGYHKWTCDKCEMHVIDFAPASMDQGIRRKALRHKCGPVEPDPRFKDD